MSTAPSASLVALPAELRNMIYKYLPLKPYDVELRSGPATTGAGPTAHFLIRRSSHPLLLACRQTSADVQDVLRPLFSGHLILDSGNLQNWMNVFNNQPSWRWILPEVTHLTMALTSPVQLPSGTPGSVFPRLATMTFTCAMENLANERNLALSNWLRADRGRMILAFAMYRIAKTRDDILGRLLHGYVGQRPCNVAWMVKMVYYGWEQWRVRHMLIDVRHYPQPGVPTGWAEIDRTGPVQSIAIRPIEFRNLCYFIELWAHGMIPRVRRRSVVTRADRRLQIDGGL